MMVSIAASTTMDTSVLVSSVRAATRFTRSALFIGEEESGSGDGAETAFGPAVAFPKRANRMEGDGVLQAKSPAPQCFS